MPLTNPLETHLAKKTQPESLINTTIPIEQLQAIEQAGTLKPSEEGEELRHILLGSPNAVRQTIHLLHSLRYVEQLHWTPLIAIPQQRLILSPKEGDVMSMLVKHLRPNPMP